MLQTIRGGYKSILYERFGGSGLSAFLSRYREIALFPLKMTFNGTSMYGVHRATQTADVTMPTLNRVSVGQLDRSSPADRFIGGIDDVRLYNKALTAAEVSALFIGTY